MGAKKVVTGIGAGIGVVYAASVGVAFGIENLTKDTPADVHHQQQTVLVAQRQFEEKKRAVTGVEKQIAHRCLPLVQAYSGTGVLAQEDFDASVKSIATDPSEVCGTNTIEIGRELAAYQGAIATRKTTHHYLNTELQNLQEVRHFAAKSASLPEAMFWGLAADVVLVVGGLTAAGIIFEPSLT